MRKLHIQDSGNQHEKEMWVRTEEMRTGGRQRG